MKLIIFLVLCTRGALATIRFGIGAPASKSRSLHSPTETSLRSRDFVLPVNRPAIKTGEIIEFELFDGFVVNGITEEIFHRGEGSATWT